MPTHTRVLEFEFAKNRPDAIRIAGHWMLLWGSASSRGLPWYLTDATFVPASWVLKWEMLPAMGDKFRTPFRRTSKRVWLWAVTHDRHTEITPRLARTGFRDLGQRLFSATPETYLSNVLAGDAFDSGHISLTPGRAA